MPGDPGPEVDQGVDRDIDPAIAEVAYAVVRQYIAGLNARDGAAINDAFNFPHFRIGADGNVIHYRDAGADHLGNFRKLTAKDGWDHTVIDDMRAVFTSPTKVHLNLDFRRLRADGSEIGAYFSLYIITRIDGHWGIQGGSGTGT